MRKYILLGLITILTVLLIAQKITVVTEEYPPYNYTEDGVITGISTEVVKEVLKRTGLEHDINSYAWARTYKMAQEKPNVLIYSIGRSEQRENMFKWVDVIVPYNVYLFKLKSRIDVSPSNMEEAKKFAVGGVRDDVRAQTLAKKGFKVDLADHDNVNIKKMYGKRIDLWPCDELSGAKLLKNEGKSMNDFEKLFLIEDLSAGLYMAFSKGTSDEIVNKCKKALNEIKKDGTYDKIKAKYM